MLEKLGYGLTDTGRYQNLTDDFSAQINAFKQAETEILTGVMIPPDLTTFWNQAKQQGLKPKIASIGKALLFPQTVEALGDAGHNLSTEVWWTPSHPFKSSLTGETAADVATAFTTATGRPWTQPIGFAHALFELAVDVMKRAEDVTDGDAVAKAIGETKLDTLVGPSPGTTPTCRPSPRRTSPRRRLSAASGASKRRRLRPRYRRERPGNEYPARRQDGSAS